MSHSEKRGLQIACFELVRAAPTVALLRLEATMYDRVEGLALEIDIEGSAVRLTPLLMDSHLEGPRLVPRRFPLRDAWRWHVAWHGDLEHALHPDATFHLLLEPSRSGIALSAPQERGVPVARPLRIPSWQTMVRGGALTAALSWTVLLPASAQDLPCVPGDPATDAACIVESTPEPEVAPTPEPTPAPTPDPTPEPTAEPTPQPTPEPTPEPSASQPEPSTEQTPAEAPAPAEAPGIEPSTAPPSSREKTFTLTVPGRGASGGGSVSYKRVRRAERSAGGRRAVKRRRAARRHPKATTTMTVYAPGMYPTIPGAMYDTAPKVPAFLETIFRRAGRRFDVPWQILAAINELETDFGRNMAVSSAGAVGWMQFMPPTWTQYGRDADGDGVADPRDPEDAIFAAARYLDAAGASENLPRAIFAYNHADWYVEAVLLRARMIGDPDPALDRLLRLRSRRLERLVLRDERITIYGCGREDIERHRVDRRVLLTLRFLAESELHPTVTSLQCGHSYYTSSGNVSEHSAGAAVDIAAINGVSLVGAQGPGSVGERAVLALATLRGIVKPHQIISLIQVGGTDNTVAMGDHADHIHVGFRPLRETAPQRHRR